MKNDFNKRILTSAILVGLVVFFVFLNLYTFMGTLFVISLISWLEFTKVIKKIYTKNYSFRDLISVLSFIYLLIFLYMSYILYTIEFAFLVMSICIFSDIGGYVIGKIFGGKKLTKISPNKTISGCIGSFIFAVFPILFIILFNNDQVYTKYFNFILLSLVVSLTCQIGDLFISYFKRKAKVKDTGKLLPGHGGILDRVDGIIFGVPISVLALTIIV